MRGRKKIHIAFYLLAAGGAALFTLLLIRQGAPHVIAAFRYAVSSPTDASAMAPE